ncbi:glycosyltransferase family 4 protein [Crenobacter cavernae]|nr:glycosyltransferase family 4 protein [Crenobacter cavernae]
MFIHSLQSGGAERVTANLANHWAAKGWKVSVVTIAGVEQDFYQLHPSVKRIALNLAGGSSSPWQAISNNLYRICALRKVLREEQPAIALSMMAIANILLGWARWGLPQIAAIGSERVHPPCLPLGRVWENLRIISYGHLDALVAQTKESADWIKTHTSSRHVAVIPNAVNWPLSTQVPICAPDSIGDCQARRLLSVGRLDSQKGFDLLIAAFSCLAQNHTDWELVILGEGPLRETLQAQIDKAGIADRVFLPGRVGNMTEWYQHADLYVMSSRFEGFPNALVEAMAHGLPTISFDCDTGPRDIIRHEVDGLLVEPENINGLEKALAVLMSNPELRARYAERAVEIRNRFSIESISSMWEAQFVEAGKV